MNEHKSHAFSKKYSKKSKLYSAIRKYGIENFTIEDICHCFSEEDMNECEKIIIDQFNSIVSGYNLKKGGEGGDTSKYIDYSTRRSYSGENNPNYGNNKLRGDNNPNSKKWIITTPTGEIIHTSDLSGFCRENNMIPESARNSQYRNITYKGYTFRHI
jgi:hypothetical protein